ncbi:hypothetical protein FQN54_004396 [Arachnomyces sp. PD_36]|nr:hypothetical protein FQN54_004396 [Arachnomyces sp. PD_36]
MAITSDLTLSIGKFDQRNVSEETKKTNTFLEGLTSSGPRWHEVGVAKYREMRETGGTPLPVPVYLPEARDATAPSRDAGRNIPLRVYVPDNGKPSKGVFLHFHGGGFVLGTHQHADNSLKMYANACQLTAISVGYRLAPEYPHPAAIHDSIDVAEYLVDNAESEYGAKLLFFGGESAGSCLAAVAAFELMRTRPDHQLAGLVFPYGWFDLTLNLPSASSFTRQLVINTESLQRFSDAYTPGLSEAERRHHSVSPLYEDMQALASTKGSFPPALFLCGTEDPLLDDTILMSTKWMIAGGEAIVKFYPEAAHGFTVIPGYKLAEEATDVAIRFVQDKLTAAL